jgi:DNA-directed RNA polymerase II subunit RPB2
MNSNDISWKIIDTMFKDNPNMIVKHHIDSYNQFFSSGLHEVFKNNSPLRFFKEYDKDVDDYKLECEIYFGGINTDKIYYGKPIIYDENEDETREHYMYPNEARLRNMTYGFTIHYDVDIKFKILIDKEDGSGKKNKFRVLEHTETLEKIYLGRFPIMLQSKLCLLNGLNREARFNMGECKNDRGGYFIIDGSEKAIVTQETRADNMLYVLKDPGDKYSYASEIRSVSEDVSKPARTLSIRMIREQPSITNKQIVVNIPQVRKAIPLFLVFRALGVISDKEIIRHCLLDLEKYESYIDLFIPCVHDASTIFTQNAALEYIKQFTKGYTVNHVLHILMNFFLPHIGELNFKTKALYLGYMVKNLLAVSVGAQKPTSRDNYRYKRFVTSGALIKDLFKEYFKLQQDNIYLKMDKEYLYNNTLDKYQNEDFIQFITSNRNHYFKDRIVETGFKKAFKGNWGAHPHTKMPGVAQELNRLTYFGFICQLRKTNLNMGTGGKMIAPRLLNGTQYGYLCPLHSPDGGNVGLHKHLSISTIITKGCSGLPYIEYFRKLPNRGVKLLDECSIEYLKNTTKIFINGAWIGATNEPIDIIKLMRLHRRNNMIDIFTSIGFNIKKNEIIIRTDSGRPVRPLYYIMNGIESWNRDILRKKITDNSISWDNLTKGFSNKKNLLETDCNITLNKATQESLLANASVIEYIDTSEAETMILAHSSLKPEDYFSNRVTHMEIHPSLILSIMANQVIFPENNPYPRDAFSCGQAKQGVSNYSTNYQVRLDKTSYVLNTGQTPLTKSRYLKYITNEEHNYGENAIVAIMCHTGYNVEDAVIVNRGALERGIFRTTYYNTYKAHEETDSMMGMKIETKFMDTNNDNVLETKEGYDYSHLDPKSGLIKEGVKVGEKTVVIGMGTNSILNPGIYVDNSIKTKKGQVGVVDHSFMTTGEEGKRIAKVKIRSERIPQIGDKFCSRAGQKGTIGIILDEADMPTTAEGIKPDIIVNPHAMPSRMTIGHLVECITSKVGVNVGAFGDCTAFVNKGSKHKELGKSLTKFGYHSSGCEILYNGMTGEQLETEIYFGPTFYLRLKHMPKDKINYRAKGPRTVLTRQTVQGRANDGGLRIGEMDRDCLIAHGMSNFIKESMMVRGDQYEMAVCNKTGCISIYNESKNIFLSPMADGPLKFVSNLDDNMNIVNVSKYGRDFSIVKVPYAFKLLIQELQAMNCQMRIITEDNVEQLTSLTEGDDIKILGFNNLEEVAEKTKDNDIESKRQTFINSNHIDMLDKLLEKTPPAEPVYNNNDYFPDESNLYNQPYGDEINQSFRPFGEEDELNPRKSQYRFNPGDLVMFEGDPEPRTTYKIIEFDDEEMKYITMAIDGEYSGKYRDSGMDELETPPKSPSYGPESPGYNPFTPEPVSMSPVSLTPIDDNIPENKKIRKNTEFRDYNTGFRDFGDELEEEDYDSDSKTYEDDRNAPNYLQRPPLSPYNTPSPDIVYERDPIGEGKNSSGEKIINRISSLDKREVDNKGLERLSSIENDKDEGEDGEDDGQGSGDKKKIV